MLNKLIEKLKQEKEEAKNFIFERANEENDFLESSKEDPDEKLDELLDVNMKSEILKTYTPEMMEDHNYDLSKYLTLKEIILQLERTQKDLEAKIKEEIKITEEYLIERAESMKKKFPKDIIFDRNMTNELTGNYGMDDFRNHCYEIGARYGLMDLLEELKTQ